MIGITIDILCLFPSIIVFKEKNVFVQLVPHLSVHISTVIQESFTDHNLFVTVVVVVVVHVVVVLLLLNFLQFDVFFRNTQPITNHFWHKQNIG